MLQLANKHLRSVSSINIVLAFKKRISHYYLKNLNVINPMLFMSQDVKIY